MNFDYLARIRQLVVLAVSLPTVGDNLNQDFTHWRIGDVRDTGAIGFHVERILSIFAQFLFFDVLEIDAGIFHGDVLFAAGDFNPEALDRASGVRAVRRLRILCWSVLRAERKRDKEEKSERGGRETGGFHGFSTNIVHKMATRRQAACAWAIAPKLNWIPKKTRPRCKP